MPFGIYPKGSDKDAEEIKWAYPLKELLWRSETAICLYGANYILKRKNVASLVAGLQWLNPMSMKVERASQGITGFIQQVKATETRYEPEDLIYYALFNPMDDLGPGISPARVALEAAGLAQNANVWASSFFRNSAFPAIVLLSDTMMTEDQRTELKGQFNRLAQGVKRAFNTLILHSGVKLQVVGQPVKDMAMPELMDQVRGQICSACGVPETMLSDAASYATAKEHKQSFVLDTVVPQCQWHAEQWNEQWLGPMNLELRFRPEELEVVQEDEADKANAAKATLDAAKVAYDVGVVTDLEMRAVANSVFMGMGLPPLDKNWKPEPKAPIPPQLASFTGQPAQQTPVVDEMSKPNPMIKADIDRWQRKCDKAGKVKPFESDYIPAGMKALIEERLAADMETAWSFLKDVDPAQLANEQRLQREIGKELNRQWALATEGIFAGREPDWVIFHRDLVDAIDDVLVSVMTEETLRQGLTVGIDFDPAIVNVAAWKWAREYAYTLVKGITETTRALVAEATAKFISTPGMTVGELRTLLEAGYSPVRAEMIATTEVTRAFAAAALTYQSMLKEMGLNFRRIWRTSADERVCPLCGPLNGKQESENGTWLAEGFPIEGPPRHVRCRCHCTLVMSKS